MPSEYLSTMSLFSPLAQQTTIRAFEHDGNISQYCWPTYKRKTLRNGGDHMARFSFTANDATLERWFEEYLAGHFTESYGGQTAFTGLIYTMRLNYHGLQLSVSLERVYNKIAVRYRTSSAGAETVTSFANNLASQGKYGTKELIQTAKTYMSSTEAAAYRDRLLDELAYPKIEKDNLSLGPTTAASQLSVEVRGYVHTLDWLHRKSTTTTAQAAWLEVFDTLGTPNFVAAGNIEQNTGVNVVREADYEPVWQRIKNITELNAPGEIWAAGCYASRYLDYKALDPATIVYNQFLKAQRPERRRGVFNVVDGNMIKVADPMVKPGNVIFFADLMGGRPVSSPLLDDPRALLIEEVEYGYDGVVVKSAAVDGLGKINAIQMALMQAQNGTKTQKVSIRGVAGAS